MVSEYHDSVAFIEEELLHAIPMLAECLLFHTKPTELGDRGEDNRPLLTQMMMHLSRCHKNGLLLNPSAKHSLQLPATLKCIY